ncbi:S-layer homology domain-containing protein, partial [Longirhabdus pacifica]|uniref:S-layer homology domain-containing protein n=1 Tax=Longirhabdus pacifica TaxID=2305227 RepID=UPI0013E8E8F5
IARATAVNEEVVDFDGFDDVPSTHWAQEEINRLVRLGFIDEADYASGLAPDDSQTRYEMTKWLVDGLKQAEESFIQAFEDTKGTLVPFTEYYKEGIPEEKIPYLAVAKGSKLVSGFPDGSFGLDKTTTRAEVVALLYNYLDIEGTGAETYPWLDELREVGTTGTNLLSMT